MEDKEYELDAEDFVSLSEEDKYIFLVDSLKKASFKATGKRWSMFEGRVQKYVSSARVREERVGEIGIRSNSGMKSATDW